MARLRRRALHRPDLSLLMVEPPDAYLMRFRDGLIAGKAGIRTLDGTTGNFEIGRDTFGWPLPDRLGVLCIPEAENVAFWDADKPESAELPSELVESPRAVVYVKLSESQLKEDLSHVMRGAEYGLEKRP